MARMVQCIKLGREAEGMDFPPFPGPLGKQLIESASKEAWAGWIRMQTMIINENRLSLADAQHRKYLMEQCEKYFFGEGVSAPDGFVAR
jgi:Fe-S cluster biosynthesis and repair protein YggX